MIRSLLFLITFAFSLPVIGIEPEAQVPDSLLPWIPWVLEGEDRRDCPLAGSGGESLCAWPGRLDLDLDRGGGLFAQRWRVYAQSWVPLPGDAEYWPQDVRAGTRPAAVVARDGVPSVKLEPGEHALSGRFQWTARPQGIALPPSTGMIKLRLDGEEIAFPRVARDGRLWLGEGPGGDAGAAADSLSLQVFRRVEDDIPLRVVTRLELDVAGRSRELALGPVLLGGGIPLGLESPLPARLEPDGALRLQVRPGRWSVEATERHPGPVAELPLGSGGVSWPELEVWVFSARPELRQVEVSGAAPVDPRQTRLPADWGQLPAYLMRPGDVLRLTQIQRGDTTPVPDRLSLSRDLWLDFGGGGYTLRDGISGDLTRSWRLAAVPPIALGQVVVNGEPRFITRLGDSGEEGVEVRQGRLDLVADGRIEGAARELPASGWALDLQSLETRLHLPPGWDLLAVGGADNLPDSWVNRWTLLDLFLVLIIALAAGRLWGPGWGALALAATVLIWQEADAPRMVWLHVLGSYALLRLLPAEPARAAMARLRALVRLYYRASLVVLAVIALPFLVDQVRNGIYPQLELPRPVSLADAGQALPRVTDAEGAVGLMEKRAAPLQQADMPVVAAAPPAPRPVPVIDPDARVQTGPGVPDWRWKTLSLTWNGPVPRDHALSLWLLSPGWGLILALAQLVLVLILGLRLAGITAKGLGGSTAAVLLAVGLTGVPTSSAGADFPSPELLEELKARLLEPPDCLPDCADIQRMLLVTEGDMLRLELQVDAGEAVALPVPGSAGGWVPQDLRLDGSPLDGLRRDGEGTFLVPVLAGRHLLGLSGPLPARSEVELPLPLRPRLVESRGEGWRVEGIEPGGHPSAQLRLLRLDPEGAEEPAASEVPPLVRVRRTLSLGVDWRVETEILRLSPPDFPVALEVPLIPGEKVLSEDIQARGGNLLVNLPPGRMGTGWISGLDPVDTLVLRAAEDTRLSEEWRVEASPLWHLRTDGIPPVHHLGHLERWLPTWRPWPGEEVRLLLTRPEGVPGPTLTLDRSLYRLVPGRRLTEATLELGLRSSQGGRHEIRLPRGAELTWVSVDGAERPLRLEGEALTLPLVPAGQDWEIRWRQPEPVAAYYSPPVPDVGLAGVNASVRVEPPRDRWVLLAGGQGIGPAILFWGLVVVLIPLAFGLGRSALTPLKGRDWLLLGLGLSQAGVWVGLLVAGWLFALGLRARLDPDRPPWRFNLTQIGLVVLSVAALSGLVAAVHQGLLGSPEMQIAGNGSTAGSLDWYQDRSQPELPRVWVVSVPMLVYRGLMLAWALWLAIRLLSWLRWGWKALAEPVLWRETGFRLPRHRRESPKAGSG